MTRLLTTFFRWLFGGLHREQQQPAATELPEALPPSGPYRNAAEPPDSSNDEVWEAWNRPLIAPPPVDIEE